MDGKTTNTIYKKNQRIQMFNEQVNNRTAMLNHTTIFNNFRSNLGLVIAYSIEIYDSKEEQPIINKCENGNDKLAKSLKCSNCNIYMNGPIFIRENGHSICNTCKVSKEPNLHAAIKCSTSKSECRNWALEEIAKHINIQCCNASKGCMFVCSITNMPSHERNCYF